jgi:hypothetical protein
MRYLVLALIGVLIAAPTLATPPTIGVYSPDNGRFSESWKGGQEGAKDNTINAASWDGAALAGQWYLTCMVASAQAQETDRDLDEFGTGYIKYETKYGGGMLWLSATGPWGDGSENYTCTVSPTGMTVTVTHQYVMGTRIAAVSDITIFGVFDNYSNCFSYTLSNAAIEGVGATTPAGYPVYQDENCDTGTSVYGAWGSVDDITLAIYSPTDVECTIPVEETTWGQIKSMYKD